MTSCVGEVSVGSQEGQLISDGKLGEQGIDRSDLNAATVACCAQCGSIYVVLPIWLHERQH